MKMWMYPGLSCPNCPSSEELSAVEVEAQIHKVLDLRDHPILGAGPVPLQRGLTNIRVSTLAPILEPFMILSFHYTHDFVQGLRGGCGEPLDADVPSDTTRREARLPSSEEMWACKATVRDWCAAGCVVRRQGMEASPRSTSTGEGGVERGATLPPSSPPHTTPSPH
jgi:hypothetical protein